MTSVSRFMLRMSQWCWRHTALGVVWAATISSLAMAADEITFTRDIAPIIFAKCSGCHHPGTAAPFSLLAYDDVKKRANQIVEVTASRFMPPWLPGPSGDNVHFVGERRLSDEQIKLIRLWVEQGAVEGVQADMPAPPQFKDGWSLGEPDLVLTLLEPYTVPAETHDTIRTFVIPVSLPGQQVVKAIDFNPGSPRAVHHASFLVDTTGNARLLDEHEPEPGYRGMGDIGLNLAGSFGGWSPGFTPQKFPDGIGRAMPKKCDLVVEMHFNPTGKPEIVQPKVGLYFVREDIVHRAVSVSLGSFYLDIAAGAKEYEIRDSFALPTAAKLLTIAPHAHYICRRITARATLPDGRCVDLLTINDWDFNWQQEYRFKEAVELPAGTVLDVKMTYDNSEANPRNPNIPSKRIRIGPTAADEMALTFLTLITVDENQRPLLEKAHQEKLLERMREAQRQRGLEARGNDSSK